MILLRVRDRQHNRGGPVISLSRRRAPDVHKSTADAAESQVGRVRAGARGGGEAGSPPEGRRGRQEVLLYCTVSSDSVAMERRRLQLRFLAGGLWEGVEWWLLANS